LNWTSQLFLGASTQTTMTSSSIKITCECGAIVNKSGLLPHMKTTKHNLLMEKAAWKQTAAKDAKDASTQWVSAADMKKHYKVKAMAKKEEEMATGHKINDAKEAMEEKKAMALANKKAMAATEEEYKAKTQTYQVQYDLLGKVLKRIFGGEMTYDTLMRYDDEDEYKLVVDITDYDEHQNFRVFIDYKEVLDVSYGNNFQLDMRHHLEQMREDDEEEEEEVCVACNSVDFACDGCDCCWCGGSGDYTTGCSCGEDE
jgi:hypothetical protein